MFLSIELLLYQRKLNEVTKSTRPIFKETDLEFFQREFDLSPKKLRTINLEGLTKAAKKT